VGSYPIVIGRGATRLLELYLHVRERFAGRDQGTPGTGGIMPVTLASSINPSSRDESVSFTATLPANATGQVTFMDGTVVLGTATIP
jgi:hypothetical protein